jgi:glycosyltransferase involved in cell wall biosynthesis
MKRLGRVKARLIIDTDDWEGAGGWNDTGDQGSGIGHRYSWAQKKVFAWQEKWGLTHNDGVTVASRALESIVWSLGVMRDRVVYVPNGVRNDQFSTGTASVRTPQSALRILLYTRFIEFKIERVIEVLRRVVEQVPDATLLVVGKGFFGEEAQLLKQADAIELRPAMNLRGSIEYVGWASTHELPELFAQAAVAIFPFDDTLINRTKCSVKLIDLLAAGVPVVADAVGQNSEYIRHHETGVLVPGGDAAAMANAVIDLWRSADRRAQLGAAAARDMRERFSWTRLAAAIEQLYTG